jgi:hypothetical protein
VDKSFDIVQYFSLILGKMFVFGEMGITVTSASLPLTKEVKQTNRVHNTMLKDGVEGEECIDGYYSVYC